jgi:hypothetical protein
MMCLKVVHAIKVAETAVLHFMITLGTTKGNATIYKAAFFRGGATSLRRLVAHEVRVVAKWRQHTNSSGDHEESNIIVSLKKELTSDVGLQPIDTKEAANMLCKTGRKGRGIQ